MTRGDANRLLDLSLLQTLCAISEGRTLAAAAAHIGLTQSAVSLQIHRLEQLVGAQLFNRRGRSLVLNDGGRTMLRHAQRMLELNGEAIEQVHGYAAAGQVRVGISVDFEHTWLTRAMARFVATHPNMRVELRMDPNSRLEHAVASGGLDLALVIGADSPGDPLQLGKAAMAWIASGRFRPTAGMALPLLLLDEPCLFRATAIAALDSAGIAWRSAVASHSLGAIWATAAAGFGVTLRCAATLPLRLMDVGPRFGLPVPPCVGIKILESQAAPDAARASLRNTLREMVGELLANRRGDAGMRVP
jgi:DNA-binding transcriptional LysR family regulator